MDSSTAYALTALFAFIGVLMIIFLALAAVSLIAKWKIVSKFGEPGWKGLIPIYGDYIMYKYVWNEKMFFVSIGIGVVASVIRSTITTMQGQGDSTGAALVIGFFSFLSLIAFVASFVLNVFYCSKLSKSFGHETGFAIGLIFLNFIFLMILAFGKDQYIGNTTQTPTNTYGDNNQQYPPQQFM